MEEHTFNTISDVNNYLKSVDTPIPNRSDSRSKKQIEISIIVKLLKQSEDEIFTNFPTKFIHHDKPDFRILSTNDSIGIEVTKAIPEKLERAKVLLENHFPDDAILEPEFFERDETKMVNDDIITIHKKSNTELFGPPSYGKSIEKRWIQGIINCVDVKTKKLNNNEFAKFQMNWLLIYDDQTRSGLDKKYILNKLSVNFNNYFNEKELYIFDRIIILSGKYFYIVDSENVLIQRRST